MLLTDKKEHCHSLLAPMLEKYSITPMLLNQILQVIKFIKNIIIDKFHNHYPFQVRISFPVHKSNVPFKNSLDTKGKLFPAIISLAYSTSSFNQ